MSRAHELRAESDARRRNRRSRDTHKLAKTSVWTTVAINGGLDAGKVNCALCLKSISIHRSSYTNIVAHYKRFHKTAWTAVKAAISLGDRRRIVERAVQHVKHNQCTLQKFLHKSSNAQPNEKVSLDIVRNICGVLLVASRQISFDVMGSPELEAFVNCTGGTVTKSKAIYVQLLPEVYRIVARLLRESTGNVKVGSFTYDGWSAKMGRPIAGMTFHYVDSHWSLKSFPLCFFNTEDLGKSTRAHTAILKTVIETSDKLDKHVVVIGGTTDNEASIALGVDEYLGYNGSMRCVCHTLALATNDAIGHCPALTLAMEKIVDICTYISYHPKVSTAIASEQCRIYQKDRIVRLRKPCPTRWHSKLATIEKYITLKPILKAVLTDDAPPLLSNYDEEYLAECVIVLREIRRVARLMEFDRKVTVSRTPRLLLKIFAANRSSREALIQREKLRKSCVIDDKDVMNSREKILRDNDARQLASLLSDEVLSRLGYLFEPISEFDLHLNWNTLDSDSKKINRESRRAVIIHISCLFDVNECTLDWIPRTCDRDEYLHFLYNVLESEMSGILGHEFDADSQNKANFMSVHRAMMQEVEERGRLEANQALKWWYSVDNATFTELRRKKLYQAPLFTDLARAFLSIQSSSASAERLFSDAGNYEGSLRQHSDSSVEEMLLMIRSYVHEQLQSQHIQTAFLSGAAQSVRNLAERIATELSFEQRIS